MPTNYTPTTPSISTTVANNKAPSGWKFMGLAPDAQIQLPPQPTMEGVLTMVPLPLVTYTLNYLSMDPVAAADIALEELDGAAVTLTVGGITIQNSYLIGGNLTFQDAGRGSKVVTYQQNFISLGQRVAYA